MRGPWLARWLVIVLVATCLFPPQAAAAPLPALPATVRVNVTENGINYTLITSTGNITAVGPDGTVLYQGPQRLVARTNVRRAEGVLLALPPKPERLTPDERIARRQQLREARSAELESRGQPGRILTIPFELSLLRTNEDALGQPIFSAARPEVIRFSTKDGVLTVNGKGYRGTLETTTDDDGGAIIVNTVETGPYLASVVGTEEPVTWEPEALAAQALRPRGQHARPGVRRHGPGGPPDDPRGRTHGRDRGDLQRKADRGAVLGECRRRH